MSEKRIIMIGGPTASGKSALAVRMARQYNGRIINADAMQIYAGLPVLTAQPSPEDKAAVPHVLYEVHDAGEVYSAGKWLTMAHRAVAETLDAGYAPILTGGTGLYFHAFVKGLAQIPAVPESIRAEMVALYDRKGEEKFRAALAQKDPASATRIARNDRQRLIRAYEVVVHTGKSLSAWQQGTAASALPHDMICEKYLLLPPREKLYAACDARFAAMIDNGAVDEVKNLIARNLSPDLPAMKILGVREIASCLRGEINREDARAQAQQATRNYAKRQMTWFRNQWPDVVPIEV